MEIKIAEGVKENGFFVGNVSNKYASGNPLVKWLMKGFETSLFSLVERASPESIHEIGCGEGYWVLRWKKQGLQARGCDFSKQVIKIASDNARRLKLSPSLFKTRSIYDLDAAQDSADLVVCCEVLEHLHHPDAGLQALQRIVGRYLIVSVPREPFWRVLNLARGKYISNWGNTPGHLQHWSKKRFIKLVSRYFEVVEMRNPLPWIMLLCRSRNRA
jgi:2-polyprenyl-3-methyl-5-hydroxy-6-metoxy-1,4-benzoquinol methylase